VANVTLAIDAELLRRARIRALQQGTTVNAVIREMLVTYAADDRALEGRRRFVALARSSVAGGDRQEREWTRASLYEERGRWPRS